MNINDRIKYEKEFIKLVNRADYIYDMYEVQNQNIDKSNKDNYLNISNSDVDQIIYYLYGKLREYMIYKNYTKSHYSGGAIYIKYNEKVYKINMLYFTFKQRYFIRIDDIENIDIIINYEDVIKYFKEKNIKTQLENINLSIQELLKEDINNINTSSEEVLEIIDELLDASKIEKILLETEKEPKQKIKTLKK